MFINEYFVYKKFDAYQIIELNINKKNILHLYFNWLLNAAIKIFLYPILSNIYKNKNHVSLNS